MTDLLNAKGEEITKKMVITTVTVSSAMTGSRNLRRHFKRKWIKKVASRIDPRVREKFTQELESTGAVKMELEQGGGRYSTSYYEVKEVELADDETQHDGKIEPPKEDKA